MLKLAKINAQIMELESERNSLKDNLNKTILDLLNQQSTLTTDFETLIGGIITIQKTLPKNDEASQKQKEVWKNEGLSYYKSNKKSVKKEAA